MRRSRAYAHLATPVPADWPQRPRRQGRVVPPVTDPWGVPPQPEPTATAQLVQILERQRTHRPLHHPSQQKGTT